MKSTLSLTVSLLRKATTLALFISYSSFTIAQAVPEVICAENFEGNANEAKGFNFGSLAGGIVSFSNDTSLNYDNSKGSVRGQYPANATGENYVWGNCKFPERNISDLYIEFKAKLPKTKHGFKFLKIFGQKGPGYANTTFGLDYRSGNMAQISFGDGTFTGNDTAMVINLDGEDLNLVGRSSLTANIKTLQYQSWNSSDWGNDWHHFRFRVKFNSGTTASNEIADGAYYVEIDGKVYVDTSGIFNRNHENLPIEKVSLFGWTQYGTEAFEAWYDDIIVSTGGFMMGDIWGVAPMPPTSITLEKNLN